MSRLRDGIRRLNDSHGAINSASKAYVHLIADYLSACPDGLPLAARDALPRFYPRDALMSSQARAEPVQPNESLRVWFQAP